MADQKAPPAGPDLSKGVSLPEFTGQTLLGHVGDEEVLLVRSGSEIFAIEGWLGSKPGRSALSFTPRTTRRPAFPSCPQRRS